jgi:SAM-dependent methyltransferase
VAAIMFRSVLQHIPPSGRSLLRMLYYLPHDTLATLRGTRDPLTPPRRLMFVGDGDYRQIGQEFLGHFVELGHLRPTDQVLDVGSGIGRMANPLTGFLDGGSYEGFDIVPEGVEWCTRQISSRFPHFRFQLADIRNAAYHPRGTQQAADYRFPYPDGTFDFAFATSVFTHMRPPEVTRYLQEIARVLRPGGRCLLTFFLSNASSLEGIASGASAIDFRHQLDGFRTSDRRTPEAAIALPEAFIRDLYESAGLELEEPIRFGSWSGRASFLSYQDIWLAQKH